MAKYLQAEEIPVSLKSQFATLNESGNKRKNNLQTVTHDLVRFKTHQVFCFY